MRVCCFGLLVFSCLFFAGAMLPEEAHAAYGSLTYCEQGCSTMNPRFEECANCCMTTFDKWKSDCFAACDRDASCQDDPCHSMCQDSCDMRFNHVKQDFACPGWEPPVE